MLLSEYKYIFRGEEMVKFTCYYYMVSLIAWNHIARTLSVASELLNQVSGHPCVLLRLDQSAVS